MISQEALDLFAANRAAMAAGDAPHLAAQVLPGPDTVSVTRDVAYVSGPEGTPLSEQMLDVYRPADVASGASGQKLPVILDFHGGGLYYGSKENNACRDMRLAEKGFAVVNANYRLVPEVSFPSQLQDAMSALVWIRDHADEYGFDRENVFVTGDSAGGALALYLCAANSSAALAGALGLGAVSTVGGTSGVSGVSGVDVRALVVTSGMFRLTGGVHATALSYYGEGYFQTPRDHILMKPYLDLDKLIVDAGESFPPVFMMTSVEDFIADNTYELARIFHARHRDHALKVWPRGRERALGHIFHIVQAGDPSAREASEAIEDIAQFCRAYVR